MKPTQVYVSGSAQDIDRVRALMLMLTLQGFVITHDWTAWEFSTDTVERCRELSRQIAGVTLADVVVLIEHVRGRGKYVEVGMALSAGIPVIVLTDDRVSLLCWESYLVSEVPYTEVDTVTDKIRSVL